MVIVDIKTPENEILGDSQLPTDYNIQMVIDELIDTLELPRLNEMSQPINYVLYSSGQGRSLTLGDTIFSSGIRNGDTLELQVLNGSNHTQPPYSGGDSTLPPTVEFPNTSEINVVLSVMDLNRHETVSLSMNRPVGDLIKQIIGNYNLPSRDNLNQLIKYKLQSKALGRFLDERTTLLEAQIPPLDRLTLHREEIAG